MKKKLAILLSAALLLTAAVLFVPVPQPAYDDGGTREYTALTYRLIRWNRLTADGVYAKTRLYSVKDKNTPLDELWAREGVQTGAVFLARVLDRDGAAVTVEPFPEYAERRSADRIVFSAAIADSNIKAGDTVRISYHGMIAESYPAQITADACEIVPCLRELPFPGQWIDTRFADKPADDAFRALEVVHIYADCFFGQQENGPYLVKVNGILPAEFCEGDRLLMTGKNARCDANTFRGEADLLSAAPDDGRQDAPLTEKPVICLYPEQDTEITVRLETDGKLTCAYPAYHDGWHVTASPDGTQTDDAGQTYNYLYWEAENAADFDFSRGFCVRGEETAAFLETTLATLGLTRREANEFIVYWLPRMEKNAYNVIAFQTDAYTETARLTVTPTPDTLLRVFMAWRPADAFVTIPPQELTSPARRGFTVVEWGGSEG